MSIKVVSVDRIRQIEAAADAAGYHYDTMMQNAGRAVALRVIEVLRDKLDARVTVLIGAGNNGGDGLVGGELSQKNKSPCAVLSIEVPNC